MTPQPGATAFKTGETTNKSEYRLKRVRRSSLIKPQEHVVVTKAPSFHFISTSCREFKPKQYRKPMIDYIPFP
jgi:hypothetical protein